MRPKTRETQILNHLEEHGQIDQKTANELYDITNIAHLIALLRKQGYKISCVLEGNRGTYFYGGKP